MASGESTFSAVDGDVGARSLLMRDVLQMAGIRCSVQDPKAVLEPPIIRSRLENTVPLLANKAFIANA